MSSEHVFEAPERFVVGTVGRPGERTFYLQVVSAGAIVTVALEKAEVAALAEGLQVLLQQVGVTNGAVVEPAPLDVLDRADDHERELVHAVGKRRAEPSLVGFDREVDVLLRRDQCPDLRVGEELPVVEPYELLEPPEAGDVVPEVVAVVLPEVLNPVVEP